MAIPDLSDTLPPECAIRRATASDRRTIRRMVFQARIDPTRLRWKRFWLIECSGSVVACGQLRDFRRAQEPGSLVVVPEWRGRGLSKVLGYHLARQATKPLYFETVGVVHAEVMRRHGCELVRIRQVPGFLKVRFGIVRLVTKAFRRPHFVLVYDSDRAGGPAEP